MPKAASRVGIDFVELAWRILETSVGAQVRLKKIGVAANGS